jgi:hypothetical protein
VLLGLTKWLLYGRSGFLIWLCGWHLVLGCLEVFSNLRHCFFQRFLCPPKAKSHKYVATIESQLSEGFLQVRKA